MAQVLTWNCRCVSCCSCPVAHAGTSASAPPGISYAWPRPAVWRAPLPTALPWPRIARDSGSELSLPTPRIDEATLRRTTKTVSMWMSACVHAWPSLRSWHFRVTDPHHNTPAVKHIFREQPRLSLPWKTINMSARTRQIANLNQCL